MRGEKQRQRMAALLGIELFARIAFRPTTSVETARLLFPAVCWIVVIHASKGVAGPATNPRCRVLYVVSSARREARR